MKRSWNPLLWSGFVLLLLGVFSYPLFFARFVLTRDFPWANLLMIALALILVAIGVVRAYGQADRYRGKISGSILAVLALVVTGLFCYGVFALSKRLPVSHGAPQVGDLVPDFTLPDSKGTPVTLSVVIDSAFPSNRSSAESGGSEQTVSTLLIFYRGYW
jgi:hypothetical protein